MKKPPKKVPGLAAHIHAQEEKSRNAAIRALREASKLLAARIIVLAPQLAGDLIKSIVVEQVRSHLSMVTSNVVERSDHGVAVEYGTQSTPAQPHWRPGIAMSREAMIRLIIAHIMKAM